MLFITSTRIGDAVLSTGLIDHFIRRHPGLRITIACGAPAAPLFAAVPGLERIHIITKRRYHLHWLELYRACFRPWSILVDLRASAIGWLLPARRRFIMGRRDDDLHRVIELGRVIGAGEEPPAPHLWLTAEDREAAARLLGDGPVLALGPAANWIGKQWPAERFAELAERLTNEAGPLAGARIALFAAPGEREQLNPLYEGLAAERLIDAVGLPLGQVAALIERTALFIGNDSGLMHVAAALKVPTLGLFGPSQIDRYHPWGALTAAVRTPKSFEDHVLDPTYDHRHTGSLMEGIEVGTVLRAAEELLERVRHHG